MPKNKNGYYAVCVGRKPGIYLTWNECLEQVNKYSKARYKKFSTLKEAQEFKKGINKETKKRNKQL